MIEFTVDYVEIVKLPIERWLEYRNLRLEALKLEPHVYQKSLEVENAFPEKHWVGRLESANEEKQSWLYFAQQDNKLIGMTGAYVRPDDNSLVEIVGVFVLPDYRGKGVGSMLLKKTLGAVIQCNKAFDVQLEVNVKQSVAIDMYKKFGFKGVGEEELVLGDGKLHKLIIMKKDGK